MEPREIAEIRERMERIYESLTSRDGRLVWYEAEKPTPRMRWVLDDSWDDVCWTTSDGEYRNEPSKKRRKRPFPLNNDTDEIKSTDATALNGLLASFGITEVE